MTIADLGTALERAVLERVRAIVSGERSGPPAVIGVRSGEVPIWCGPVEVSMTQHDVGDRRVRVEACPSVLAVLDALARHPGSDTTLVILTDRPEVDLGDDVLARLHRGRLFDASRQTLLDDLLGARQLDPGIRRHGWLVDALVDLAHAGTLPSTQGATLSLRHATTLVLGARLGIDPERLDPVSYTHLTLPTTPYV